MELCDEIFYKLKWLSWPLFMSNNESLLTDFRTSTEGKSRGWLYMTQAALLCVDYKALNLFLLVAHPQLVAQYRLLLVHDRLFFRKRVGKTNG